MSFRGSRGESVRYLSSLSYTEMKGEFWCSAFKTWTSNFIEWMLSLWVRFRVQYSLLLHYEILEKLVTLISVWLKLQISFYRLSQNFNISVGHNLPFSISLSHYLALHTPSNCLKGIDMSCFTKQIAFLCYYLHFQKSWHVTSQVIRIACLSIV